MDFRFEIKRKDHAARIGQLRVNGKELQTPCLLPVFNITKPTIPMDELVNEFGCKALMTNAYSLLKNEELKADVEELGIHKLLGFDGIVATDSGSYQLMVYGAVEVTNRQIIDFEAKIGADIASFLDIPSPPDTFKMRAAQQLQTTLERAKEAKDAPFVVNAAVQGAKYPDLRAKAAREIGKDFDLAAIGGIVPLMESYRFAELVHVIAAAKKNLPTDMAVHGFGLGHPMLFPLAVLLGCDLFDSAAYALYAQNGRYMTDYGTERLEDLEHLGCPCPICQKHGIGLKNLYGDDQVVALAKHNLYLSLAMIERIKQAICEGRLFDLVALHARSHPNMLEALKALLEHGSWLAELDPISKERAFGITGFESEQRPEVINAKDRMERVSSLTTIELPPFGAVKDELLDLYPFNGVYSFNNEPRPKVRDLAKLRAIMEYQFGKGAGDLLPDNLVVKKSKNTKRIRWLWHDKKMIATVRAQDHMIIPHTPLARLLHELFPAPALRVKLKDDEEAAVYVRDGKSVMCKFVQEVDPNLRAGDECLVVDSKDELIRSGTMHLSPKEIMDFEVGMAVRTR